MFLLVFFFILVPQIKIHLFRLVLPIQACLFIFVPPIQYLLFLLLFICLNLCLFVLFASPCLLVYLSPCILMYLLLILSTCHTYSPFVYMSHLFPLCLLFKRVPPSSPGSTLVHLFLTSTCSSSPCVFLPPLSTCFFILCTRFFCCILVLFLSSMFPSSRLLAVSPLVYLLFLLSSTCCFSSRVFVVSPLVCLLFLLSSTCCFSSRLLAVPILVYFLLLFLSTCCSSFVYLIFFLFNCFSSCLLVPHLTCLLL